MYRCENCNRVTGHKTSLIRRVTKTKPTNYPSRWEVIRKNKVVEVKTFPFKEEVYPPRPNKYEKWVCVDKGGQGQEIIHEASVCPKCAKRFDQGEK